jgi:hypothetical protein
MVSLAAIPFQEALVTGSGGRLSELAGTPISHRNGMWLSTG